MQGLSADYLLHTICFFTDCPTNCATCTMGTSTTECNSGQCNPGTYLKSTDKTCPGKSKSCAEHM